ncbi:50S ribosomal protein L31 [Buchnera aphidicola]|uniref:50S ribosomal protein L31 n=1 Tax=Buchnera aphidicola TaxID=9 RepID=UPI0034644990
MKKKIHPNYHQIQAVCSCNKIHIFFSTIKNNIQLDICSECHPFYTGKQRTINTGGRIEKFKKRFNYSGN